MSFDVIRGRFRLPVLDERFQQSNFDNVGIEPVRCIPPLVFRMNFGSQTRIVRRRRFHAQLDEHLTERDVPLRMRRLAFAKNAFRV